MSHRYAVLWETGSHLEKARPAGLVVEQDGFVLVEARDEYGIPARYDKPFQVLGPDMVLVEYTPGHPQYFDHVVLDLSRGFTVGKEGQVGDASQGVVLKLLAAFVLPAIRREHPALYCQSKQFPTIAAYQQQYYAQAEESSPTERQTVPVPETTGAAVAA